MTVAMPQWIERMYAGKVGRDHLGLGSVSSDQILPEISPSINVLTYHPRYHSFYAFLLYEFWQRDHLARTYDRWVRFFRPREFIFSVGAHLCKQDEHDDTRNIVGSNTTEGLARERRPSYDTSTEYIKNKLGGYGLYYRTVMAELGLIYPGGPGLPYPIDVPSELGEKLALAFKSGVEHTRYYREYFDQDNVMVPIEVIEEYIQPACLCQAKTDSAPDAHLLRDLFLHGGLPELAESRRATFRYLLDISSQTNGFAIDQDAFRQLAFFGQAVNGARYSPANEEIASTHKRWRLYQAREYYAFALNAMWHYLCGWGIAGNGDIRPIPAERFWLHLEDVALDFNQLATILKLPHPNLDPAAPYSDLLTWLEALIGADGNAFDSACTLDSPLNEHRLYSLADGNQTDPSIMVAGMIVMLGLIYLRFGHEGLWAEPEWSLSQKGEPDRLSLDRFVKTARHRLKSDPPSIKRFARWIYDDYIILQHQFIATRKLPENTFRFRREGLNLRFYNLWNALSFMNSRFDAIDTTVQELGFCNKLGEEQHKLSALGRRLLSEGDTG